MSDLLAKIRALVARASSTHEEEARTSAVLACRQILEHKIILSMPGAEPEEQTDEELRKAAWEYVARRQRQATGFVPHPSQSAPRGAHNSHGTHHAAQARARAYARATRQSEAEQSEYFRRPHHISPFDPYEAPFEQVRDFVKARGIDLHDNGSGNFSAHMGTTWCKGAWHEVVTFMFSLLETGRAHVFWKEGER